MTFTTAVAALSSILSDPFLPWLGALTLRATLWLGVAAVIARLARTSSARHLAWTIGLLGVLVLPLAMAGLPGWKLAVLPASESTATSPAPSSGSAESAAAAAPPPAASSVANVGPTSPGPSATKLPPSQSPTLRRLPTVVWSLGLVLVLTTVARDRWLRFRLGRSALPVGERGWLEDADRLARQLNTGRPELLCSPDVAVPVTWGHRRPIVLLPPVALEWGAARRACTLIHELAHARRADSRLFVLGRLACAVAWFHPLVWWAARRLRAESELACDDLVVTTVSQPADYADELLSLARTARPLPGSACAALARPTGLQARVRAILDGRRNRASLPRRRVVAMILGGLVALPAIATVQVVRAAGVVAPATFGFADEGWVDLGMFDSTSSAEETSDQVTPTAPPSPSAPTSPASPAAPAAPAPAGTPVPESFLDECPRLHSTSTTVDDDHTRVKVKAGRCRFEIESRGEIVFRADETGVESMGRRALFVIDDDRPSGRRTLRLEGGSSGEPTWEWKVNGRERPVDDEARAWLAQMIARYFRTTGFQAEERTARILERGGVPAVFDEIEQLSSDYVRRRYFTALMEATTLSDDESVRWIETAGRTIDGDYDLATTLTALPSSALSHRPSQAAFIEAAGSIDSDYEMRRVLTPLIRNPSLSPDVLSTLVSLCRRIESDYELATLLSELADLHADDAPLPGVFYQVAATIESDYELARTLKKVLEHPVDSADLVALLETAVSIESDYELASVLVQVATRHSPTGNARSAFDRAAASIQNDYERRRVQRALGG